MRKKKIERVECDYRDCSEPVGRGRSKFCSDRHAQAAYRLQVSERRIFTLAEIAAMPSTLTQLGYVNRRIRSGVSIAEHVLVMESVLGIRLPPGASVHHRNGERGDNDPANLELWLSHHPSGQRMKCPKCGWPNLETY